jgi:hypothetical protein
LLEDAEHERRAALKSIEAVEKYIKKVAAENRA